MPTDYLALARDAYDASTSFVDANYRKDWDYSLRAFRNEHSADSKYSSDEYKSRSRIFHPKTRSIIRKNEAAGMQAAFSNRELVSTEPANPDNPRNLYASAALKEVLQYRLTHTIPTFQIYLGGLQDAQTTGAVVSYQDWEYTVRNGKKIADRPRIELCAIENVRFDPGASWINVVNTSPYLCHIIPMYVKDVRAMMKNKDAKTGKPKWKFFKDEIIQQARPDEMDSTRQARLGNTQDPNKERPAIKSFDIVWVMRWFMEDSQDGDRHFYTLGTQEMLTDDVPIEQAYFHGVRPYAMGYAILETHRAHKSSMPTLIRPLQQAINQVANSRFDNVQYVLNKRTYVARGRQTDTSALVRNVPGAVILTSNPKEDIIESNHQDVTSSAYVEHDRLNAESDDLAGNFSPSTKVANNAVNDTLGGSKLASAGAGLMSEYLIHTVNETWWKEVLRQIGLLERKYETDKVILTVCGKKAGLFPSFGPDQLQDLIEEEEVIVSVDMAMGDPMQRFQKFIIAIKSCIELIATAPPGVNVQECCKEIMANAGYRDGERFISSQADPRLLKAMQTLQQMRAQLEGKTMELQAGLQDTQMKLASNEKIETARLQVDYKRISEDMALRNKQLDIEHQNNSDLASLKHAEINKPEPVEIPEPVDPEMRQVELADRLAGIDLKEAQALKARSDAAIAEKTGSAQAEKLHADAAKTNKEVDDVSQRLQEMAEAVASIGPITKEFSEVRSQMGEMMKGMGALAGVVMQPKRKPVSVKGGKKAGKISITFDNGDTEELVVERE